MILHALSINVLCSYRHVAWPPTPRLKLLILYYIYYCSKFNINISY